MELPSKVNKNRISGDFEVSLFTLEETRHLFHLLSSGLYSDKIRAIIRELSCNALDAHQDAGVSDTPFELYLPNHKHPWFKIRDFGKGISPTDIIEVYTKYMKSTKKGSNDQIGCFGLGSKSPFAYAENFTVISYHAGVKTTYSMVVGPDGVPMSIPVSQEDTEETGLEISFPVKAHDIESFLSKAAIVLRPFDKAPDIFGAISFSPRTYSEYDSPPQYLCGENHTPVTHQETIAVMGNVEYPLQVQDGFSPNAKAVFNLGLLIKFPIGSFEVTPSRESISWTEFSVARVNKVLEDIFDETVLKFNDELKDATSLWHARSIIGNTSTNTRALLASAQFMLASAQFTWKNQTLSINDKSRVPLDLSKRLAILTTGSKYDGLTKIATCTSNTISIIDKYTLPMHTQFYVADCKSARFRLSHLVRSSMYGSRFLLISPSTRRNYREILNLIGISTKDVKFCSSLPKPERAKKKKSTVSSKTPWIYKMESNKFSKSFVDDDFDASDGGVYAPLAHNSLEFEDVEGPVRLHYSTVMQRLAKAEKIGLYIPTIYACKRAKVGTLTESGSWTSLQDYLIEVLSDACGVEEFDRLRRIPDDNPRYHNHKYPHISTLKSVASAVKNPKSDLLSWSKEIENEKSLRQDKRILHSILSLVEHSFSLIPVEEVCYYEKICVKYPLLTDLHYANHREYAEYVDIKDLQQAKKAKRAAK